MPRTHRFPTPVLAAIAGLLIAVAAAAQSFAPVAQVNDDVVTAWELQQRQRMLSVLRAPPEVQAGALDSLINERLQLQAAESLGVEVREEEIAAGIEEFASRGDLTAERFLELIGNEGVDRTTIRDFVVAGLAWRSAVQARFGAQVDITEDEIAREREAVGPTDGPRVLLSEIILPARNEIEELDSRALAEEIRGLRSFDAFSAAAREHSMSDSADEGGRIDWIPLVELQGPVAATVEGLQPGQVTPVIEVPEGLALFQLRGRSQTPLAPGEVVMDYAQVLIPGGRSDRALRRAAAIEAESDTCDDLYGTARGAQVMREERPRAQIPGDVRAELERLDRNEISTRLTRGDALVLLMLCERGVSGSLAIEDTAASARLRNEELAGLADIWLAELRADAFIRTGGE
jgi:peptidyl-prolyl cis-trans isomerase SurA